MHRAGVDKQARQMSLHDAVALVAGASGDIGRAIAFDLLGAGAEVFMLGRGMARLAHPPPPENARAKMPFHRSGLDRACYRAYRSGYLAERPFGRPGFEHWDLRALPRTDSLRLSDRSERRWALRADSATNAFHVQSKGQVIFINSTQGLKATAEIGQYAATKHAMKAVADSLRDEVNRHGVRVASIFLGTNGKRAAARNLCGGEAAIPTGAPYPA